MIDEKEIRLMTVDSQGNPVTIRSMAPEDLEAVYRLETACFETPWSRESLESELLSHPFSHGLVVEAGQEIAGFAFYWLIFESAQLADIGVSPAFRGRALGDLLLQEIIAQSRLAGCETISLEVRISNEPAKRLYEKAGFTPLHIAKHYYENGEDAIVMALGI